MDKKVIDELKGIVAEDQIISDGEILDIYSRDESEDLSFLPSVVIFPRSELEVSKIMEVASRYEIPVTPRGGGTGLSGGALPIRGGIVLSLEKMDKILEIDRDNFFVRCEAGVVVEVLQNEVEKLGLFYPPDPASRGTCMIGGNIAENSGGPRAAKYGVTSQYLLGLRGVLSDGTIFSWGGGILKNVSGYNMPGIFIGSEGTLAIITEATLRLITKPKIRKMILASFESKVDGVKAVAEIYRRGGNPSVLEFLEKAAIEVSEKYIGSKWPVDEGEAYLLIEVDGGNEELVDMEIELIYEVLEEFGSGEAVLAEDSAKMDNLWRLRRSVGEAVKSISTYKEEDTVVPRAKLHLLYELIDDLKKKHGVDAISYGHAGDGNIHVNLLKRELSEEEWKVKLSPFIDELFSGVVELGGAITGEHGVGYTQKGYLHHCVDDGTMEVMKKLKSALDPKGILNPDKIFV
jgi:glycolate oxidase